MRKVISVILCISVGFLPVVSGAEVADNIVIVDRYKNDRETFQLTRILSAEDDELRVRLISREKNDIDKIKMIDQTVLCEKDGKQSCKTSMIIYECSGNDENKECTYGESFIRISKEYPIDRILSYLNIKEQDYITSYVCALRKNDLPEQKQEQLVTPKTRNIHRWGLKKSEQDALTARFTSLFTLFEEDCLKTSGENNDKAKETMGVATDILAQSLQSVKNEKPEKTGIIGKIIHFLGTAALLGIAAAKTIVNPSQGAASLIESSSTILKGVDHLTKDDDSKNPTNVDTPEKPADATTSVTPNNEQ